MTFCNNVMILIRRDLCLFLGLDGAMGAHLHVAHPLVRAIAFNCVPFPRIFVRRAFGAYTSQI